MEYRHDPEIGYIYTPLGQPWSYSIIDMTDENLIHSADAKYGAMVSHFQFGRGYVTNVAEDEVTLDFNLYVRKGDKVGERELLLLAGRKLVFDIEVLEIKNAGDILGSIEAEE